MKNLIILVLLSSFFSCVYEPSQKGISILNVSDSAIYVTYSFTDSFPSDRKLTLFQIEYFNDSCHIVSPNYRINAHSSGGIGISGREELVNEAKDGKLRIFFIKEKTIRENSWEDISKKEIYEKKITLTIEELQKLNWTIRYSCSQ
jgi:hypothetical protein